jgi:RNA polymerase sigma-70 factor (family 1)
MIANDTQSTDQQEVFPINMGEVADFERVYQFYHAPLLRYCRELTDVGEASEDIVSQLFLTLWRKRVMFNDTEHAKALLYRSAKNACRNFIRHEKIAFETEGKISARTTEFSEDPFDALIRSETWAEIYRAIQELPLQNRKVITLSYLEGLTNQEIVDEMGLPMETIKTYKKRGLAMLRNKIPGNLFALLLAFSLLK